MLSTEYCRNRWFVHVNKNTIARNRNKPLSEREPAVRFQKGLRGKSQYAMRVRLPGPSEVIYDAEQPLLPCGARLVIVTEQEPEIIE